MFILETVYHIFKEFISLTLQVFPYFVAGTAFGALMEAYIKPEFALRYLNRGTSSVIYASILGAILPGCACTTVPMAEGLKEKGSRLGTIAAFIMVSPLLSPHTVVLTYGMLGLKFTVARVIFSLSGAIILGIAFNYFEDKKVKGFVLPAKPKNNCCESCPPDCKIEKKGFWRSFIRISRELGKYFILGMFIASLFTVLIPKEAIPRYIGSSGVFAYVVAVLVGIPIYICEGEEIPITLALLKLGLSAGPAFTFLLGSIGTCIPTMIMAQKIIGKKPTLFYIIGWFVFAICSGLLFSLFF
ncbi:permease [bacterium]|nr:permease [bacterium]MBU2462213.1 permease [bacterium]